MEGQDFHIQNKDFQRFLDLFPVGNFPFKVSAQEGSHPVDSHPAISEDLAKTFICSPANSQLKCDGYPGEAEDQRLSHYFFPYAKLLSGQTFFVLYQLNYQGHNRIALASYTSEGEMLSRILFAGNGKKPVQVSGTLSENLTVQISFHTPSRRENTFFDTETKTYRVVKGGYFQQVLMSDTVIDEFY